MKVRCFLDGRENQDHSGIGIKKEKRTKEMEKRADCWENDKIDDINYTWGEALMLTEKVLDKFDIKDIVEENNIEELYQLKHLLGSSLYESFVNEIDRTYANAHGGDKLFNGDLFNYMNDVEFEDYLRKRYGGNFHSSPREIIDIWFT